MLTIGDGQGQDREAASSNPVATFPRQMMDGIITLGKATPHPATPQTVNGNVQPFGNGDFFGRSWYDVDETTDPVTGETWLHHCES